MVARPGWAQAGLSPEERASLHESLVEILNEIRRCEDWEARIQPAIDHLR